MKKILTINDVDFEFKKPAEKFFKKHEVERQEFKEKVVRVLNKDHAELVNVKPLQGRFAGYSRIAIGSYRVIYQVINGEIIVVSVAYAGSRGDIYKKFQG